VVAGAVTLLATGIAAGITYPRSGELLDLVNAWNRAHPGEQVDVGWAPSIEVAPQADAAPRDR
jgi:hypothetical protein